MLTLTRPQRQALGTIALLAGAVAPTVAVGLWAYEVNRPGHRHEVEADLARRLGLKVTLESVRYPAPGEVVGIGVVLWQPEARRRGQLVEVARAGRVRARTVGRQVVLETEGLRVRGEGPAWSVEQIGHLIARTGGAEAGPERVSLAAPTCELVLSDQTDAALSYALTDVAATYRAGTDGVASVAASYRVEVAGADRNRCELELHRDRRGARVRTSLVLRTVEGGPLPGAVLGPFFDGAGWLGPDATVRGSLMLTRDGDGPWSGRFEGVLDQVDLAAVLGRRVPDHQLEARARVTLDSALWGPRAEGQRPGWIEAEGELIAGPGRVSEGLLRALDREMGFRLAESAGERPDAAELLAFQGLGLRFRIGRDGGVGIEGALGEPHDPGAVLIDRERLASLAFAPERTADLLGLRRTLGPADPEGVTLVPTTPELRFLDYLPAPGAHRRPSASAN